MDGYRFECPFEGCIKSYNLEKTLQKHIEAIHAERPKFQCEVCQRILSSLQNFNEHRTIHTGERPFVCKEPNCGLTFRQACQLSAHKKIHKALTEHMMTNSFVELKVILIQLTTLISSDHEVHRPIKEFVPVEVTSEIIPLPPVSGHFQFGPLPKLN